MQVVLKKKIIFICTCVFLWLKPRTPMGGAISDPETLI